MKRFQFKASKYQQGFTLIEVMLVVLLVGMFMAIVSFNPFSHRPEDKLEEESARFSGIFNLAAEYSLLNNAQLGLVITKTSYQFVSYSGVRWEKIQSQELLDTYEVAEDVELELSLDDLPIDDDSLFSDESMFESDSLFDEEKDFRGTEKKKRIIPKVLLFSGGDFTSFKLTFAYTEEFQEELDQDIEYQVLGLFTLPLQIKGPLYNGEE